MKRIIVTIALLISVSFQMMADIDDERQQKIFYALSTVVNGDPIP